MKVYVIMGNDYPDAVFKDKEIAEAFCEKKNKADKKEIANSRGLGRIYWRSYEFTLDAEVGK